MPLLRLDDGLDLHYRIDDFTDPWTRPETALFIHGIAESGDAWYAWTPPFARRFRVLRPDMRGYGRSTPVPAERAWSLERLAADYELLLRHLGLERVHLIGAKIGGMAALYFAATRPAMVHTLTVVGAPASGRQLPPAPKPEEVQSNWTRTMDKRLGSNFPAAAKEYWTRLMETAPASTMTGMRRDARSFDAMDRLSDIKCPTLVITAKGSLLGSPDEVRAWQKLIPDSELALIDSDSFHVAVSDADEAARVALGFITRRRQ